MRIFAYVKCICLDHTNKKEQNPKSFKSRMFFNSYRNEENIIKCDFRTIGLLLCLSTSNQGDFI